MAMMLTAIGTYGLVSYAARQSTHEIGIRIAVGADRRDLLTPLSRTRLEASAWPVRFAAWRSSLLIARVLASLLYGVSPTDVVSFSARPGAGDDYRPAGVAHSCLARIEN